MPGRYVKCQQCSQLFASRYVERHVCGNIANQGVKNDEFYNESCIPNSSNTTDSDIGNDSENSEEIEWNNENEDSDEIDLSRNDVIIV